MKLAMNMVHEVANFFPSSVANSVGKAVLVLFAFAAVVWVVSVAYVLVSQSYVWFFCIKKTNKLMKSHKLENGKGSKKSNFRLYVKVLNNVHTRFRNNYVK